MNAGKRKGIGGGRLFRVAFGLCVMAIFSACPAKPEPPGDWSDRILVYRSLVSDTGYAGYYLSFQEKTFLTFGQFLATIPGNHGWRQEQENIWVLTLKKYDMDFMDNGPLDMYFKKEESPSGNVNVLLLKAVTRDYEIPWVLLDQVVMRAGEQFLNRQSKVS